MVKKSEEKAFR
jgi:hypothetical protein